MIYAGLVALLIVVVVPSWIYAGRTKRIGEE